MEYNYDYVYELKEDASYIENADYAKEIFSRYAGKYNFLLVIKDLKDKCPTMFIPNDFGILELHIGNIIEAYVKPIVELEYQTINNSGPKKYILQEINEDISDIKDIYNRLIPEFIEEDKKNNIIKILKQNKNIFEFLSNIDLLLSDYEYTEQEQLSTALSSAYKANNTEQQKLLLKSIYKNIFGEIDDKEFSNDIICIDVNFYNKSNVNKLILHIYYIFIILYINNIITDNEINIQTLNIDIINHKIKSIVTNILNPPRDNIKKHGFTIHSAPYLTECFENIYKFKVIINNITKLLNEYSYWINLIDRLFYLYPYKHTILNIKIPYTLTKNNKIYLKNKIKSKLPYNINMKLEYIKNKTILINNKVPINIDGVRGDVTYIGSYNKNGLNYYPYNNADFINLINIGLYYKNILPIKLTSQFTLSDSYFTKITLPSNKVIYTLNKTFFNNFINFYIDNYSVNIIIIDIIKTTSSFLIYTNTIKSIDKCINPNDPIVLYYNKSNIKNNTPVFYFDLVIKFNNILLNKI